MPRRPLGQTAMTAAERQHRRRARIRSAVASLSPERRFRRDLLAFVETYRALHPALSAGEAEQSLHALGIGIKMDEYCRSEAAVVEARLKNSEPNDHIKAFLRAAPHDLFYHPFSPKDAELAR